MLTYRLYTQSKPVTPVRFAISAAKVEQIIGISNAVTRKILAYRRMPPFGCLPFNGNIDNN